MCLNRIVTDFVKHKLKMLSTNLPGPQVNMTNRSHKCSKPRTNPHTHTHTILHTGAVCSIQPLSGRTLHACALKTSDVKPISDT